MRCVACDYPFGKDDAKAPKPDKSPEDMCHKCLSKVEEASNPEYDPSFKQFEGAKDGLCRSTKVN